MIGRQCDNPLTSEISLVGLKSHTPQGKEIVFIHFTYPIIGLGTLKFSNNYFKFSLSFTCLDKYFEAPSRYEFSNHFYLPGCHIATSFYVSFYVINPLFNSTQRQCPLMSSIEFPKSEHFFLFLQTSPN